MLQFRAGLRIPSAALEERRNVGHDEAETVQNRPGDGNALKPCAGIIHGLAVLGKVHQQQGNGGADYSCDGGDLIFMNFSEKVEVGSQPILGCSAMPKSSFSALR